MQEGLEALPVLLFIGRREVQGGLREEQRRVLRRSLRALENPRGEGMGWMEQSRREIGHSKRAISGKEGEGNVGCDGALTATNGSPEKGACEDPTGKRGTRKKGG